MSLTNPDLVNPEILEEQWGDAQEYWPACSLHDTYLGHMAYQFGYNKYWAELDQLPVPYLGDKRIQSFKDMVNASIRIQNELYDIWRLLKTYEDFGMDEQPELVLLRRDK